MNRRALVVGLLLVGVLVITALHLHGASSPSVPGLPAAAPPAPGIDRGESRAPSEPVPELDLAPAKAVAVVVEAAARRPAEAPPEPAPPQPAEPAPPPAALPSVGSRAAVAEPGAAPGDVVARFHEAFGDPDPAHERQMIEARRQRSLEVVERLMAGLAEQEEAARRRGDLAHAQKLADSLHRLEWRHRVLDTAPADDPSAEGTDPVR